MATNKELHDRITELNAYVNTLKAKVKELRAENRAQRNEIVASCTANAMLRAEIKKLSTG